MENTDLEGLNASIKVINDKIELLYNNNRQKLIAEIGVLEKKRDQLSLLYHSAMGEINNEIKLQTNKHNNNYNNSTRGLKEELKPLLDSLSEAKKTIKTHKEEEERLIKEKHFKKNKYWIIAGHIAGGICATILGLCLTVLAVGPFVGWGIAPDGTHIRLACMVISCIYLGLIGLCLLGGLFAALVVPG